MGDRDEALPREVPRETTLAGRVTRTEGMVTLAPGNGWPKTCRGAPYRGELSVSSVSATDTDVEIVGPG